MGFLGGRFDLTGGGNLCRSQVEPALCRSFEVERSGLVPVGG